MAVRETHRTVELSNELVSQVESRLPRTEFESADEYIAFVVEEVLYHVEAETADDDFEAVDEQEIKDRLQSLGYLDE